MNNRLLHEESYVDVKVKKGETHKTAAYAKMKVASYTSFPICSFSSYFLLLVEFCFLLVFVLWFKTRVSLESSNQFKG